jgi:hypothetical protein
VPTKADIKKFIEQKKGDLTFIIWLVLISPPNTKMFYNKGKINMFGGSSFPSLHKRTFFTIL